MLKIKFFQIFLVCIPETKCKKEEVKKLGRINMSFMLHVFFIHCTKNFRISSVSSGFGHIS